MKKGNRLYKVISFLTLILPLPVYLFIMATVFSIKADYVVKNVDFDAVNVVYYDTHSFIWVDDETAVIDGIVKFDSDVGAWGVEVFESDILKVGKKYYGLDKGELKDIEIKVFKQEKKTKIPFVIFVSIFGVLIVALVISKKMQWQKKYPRIAVMLSLLVGTIILYAIDMVVGGLLGVFLVATITWGVYLIEYGINQGKIKKSDQMIKLEHELEMLERKLK